MILVTGASGTIGSEVVKQLVEAGQKVRALVHKGGRPSRFGPGVELVEGDLEHPASLAPAFQGVTGLFLLAGGAKQAELEANAVAAAKSAQVKHIVKLSVMGADFEPGIALGRVHRSSEKNIEASGIPWTFLRPTGFMSNALGFADTIKAQGAVYQSTGDGKISVIDPRDIAAVAVKALTGSGHAGKVYTLTGPEPLSSADLASTLSKELGKPVRFVDVPMAAAKEGMVKAGMSAAYADVLLEYFALVRAGHGAGKTDDVEKVLGRKPRTFGAWAKENLSAFRA